MAVFVCILEFEGGTYVSKVTAKTHRSAVSIWVSRRLPALAKKYLGKVSARRIKRGMAEDRKELMSSFPTTLDRLPEVGYVPIWHSNRYFNHMHVVRCS